MASIYAVTERDSYGIKVLTYHPNYNEAFKRIDALCHGIKTIYHEETCKWYYKEQYTRVNWDKIMTRMKHEQDVRFGGMTIGGYLLKSYSITRIVTE